MTKPDTPNPTTTGLIGEVSYVVTRFKSTTRWANGAELVIEKFPAPDLLESSCRAASAARVLWPDEQMVYIAVEASDA